MSYLKDFKRMAVGRDLPKLNEGVEHDDFSRALVNSVRASRGKAELDEGAVTSSIAAPHAAKLLKTIDPTTRKDTLKRVAKAIPDFPVVLAYFQQRLADPYYKGKFSYHWVEDLFGGPFIGWKAGYGISDEDPDWEEMSRDPLLASEIEKVVRAAEPKTVDGYDTRDYASASVKQERLSSLLRSLVRNGGNDSVRAEAVKICNEILDILK